MKKRLLFLLLIAITCCGSTRAMEPSQPEFLDNLTSFTPPQMKKRKMNTPTQTNKKYNYFKILPDELVHEWLSFVLCSTLKTLRLINKHANICCLEHAKKQRKEIYGTITLDKGTLEFCKEFRNIKIYSEPKQKLIPGYEESIVIINLIPFDKFKNLTRLIIYGPWKEYSGPGLPPTSLDLSKVNKEIKELRIDAINEDGRAPDRRYDYSKVFRASEKNITDIMSFTKLEKLVFRFFRYDKEIKLQHLKELKHFELYCEDSNTNTPYELTSVGKNCKIVLIHCVVFEKKVDVSCLNNLVLLEMLTLHNVNIRNFNPTKLKNLKSLTVLNKDFYDNDNKHRPIRFNFSQLRAAKENLKHIVLSNLLITYPQYLKELKSLVSLQLFDCHIDGYDKKGFEGTIFKNLPKNLKKLYLCFCNTMHQLENSDVVKWNRHSQLTDIIFKLDLEDIDLSDDVLKKLNNEKGVKIENAPNGPLDENCFYLTFIRYISAGKCCHGDQVFDLKNIREQLNK